MHHDKTDKKMICNQCSYYGKAKRELTVILGCGYKIKVSCPRCGFIHYYEDKSKYEIENEN